MQTCIRFIAASNTVKWNQNFQLNSTHEERYNWFVGFFISYYDPKPYIH
jgi:hypothetical protein